MLLGVRLDGMSQLLEENFCGSNDYKQKRLTSLQKWILYVQTNVWYSADNAYNLFHEFKSIHYFCKTYKSDNQQH